MFFRQLGLLLLIVSVSFAQQFISEPSDKTVYVGQDVTLNCVLNSGHGSHLWVKDTVLITQEYNTLSHLTASEAADSTRYTRYTVKPSEITGYYGYSLHISNIQLQDAGIYQCIVLTGGNGLQSHKAALQVLSAPEEDFPTCTTSTNGLHVSVGEDVTFSCQSNGGSPATILKWLRDTDLTEPSEATNTHTWTVTEEDDRAIFTCEGEHQLWSTHRSCSIGPFRLNTDEPTVTLTGFEEVEVDSTATFLCSARDISTPEYSWYIDGVEVQPGHERIIFSDPIDNNVIIRIPDISLGDAGTSVQCKINFYGGILTSKVIALRVQINPTTIAPVVTDRLPVDDDLLVSLSKDSGVSNSTIVGASMGIIALILVVLIIVGIVLIRRAAKDMKKQDENSENFTMRSRYVGVLRSWFFPVHEHTQKSMASFVAGPAMSNKAFET